MQDPQVQKAMNLWILNIAARENYTLQRYRYFLVGKSMFCIRNDLFRIRIQLPTFKEFRIRIQEKALDPTTLMMLNFFL